MTQEQSLTEALQQIKLAIFDVDGVLTDGRLHYGPNGEELKVFHAHDGHGLKALMRAGIEIAIISGRDCQALRIRLNDLGIKHSYLGKANKIPALDDLLKKTNLTAEQACYMGDDVPDIEPMSKVAVAFAPTNARAEVREIANWVSNTAGGHGAVREVCDFILHHTSSSHSSEAST